uniref:Uncharacterized protein n=1 Tax=Kwoniella bestiolae CBS 10118 TaxID=1296100 RepID=A0A1B9G8J1_9TREE|nr:hypothetical protein I302_02196 [Kwoniella bestiolae CBS 10118]OCF27355.1 hypothetical protein I302_02196 [Kwoniella bestiolae CBS 10118]
MTWRLVASTSTMDANEQRTATSTDVQPDIDTAGLESAAPMGDLDTTHSEISESTASKVKEECEGPHSLKKEHNHTGTYIDPETGKDKRRPFVTGGVWIIRVSHQLNAHLGSPSRWASNVRIRLSLIALKMVERVSGR